MGKKQTQILAMVTAIFVGITLFSVVNAKTPQENKLAGVAFLTANAKKANIITTNSGLQYEILTPGTGNKSPNLTDTVTVNYRGTKIDGQEFDSSDIHGEPATFPLNALITGWREGLLFMKEGAKYRFYIPSELAYGESGGGAVEPNEALIFDVELLKIKQPE
ncbi:MAG: FKBP-type peptidyl-prolyl cis-trans isomerase [Methylovulum sp.]|nr:FKBP-type peptidyl-prolyl cis-trans isomerase [Methylovulum sp.]